MSFFEKRTYDARLYDLDCSALLAAAETITQVVSVSADQGALAFSTPVVNTAPAPYPGGTVAAGKVIQVEISDGVIPDGADSMGCGLPNLMCTVRARFKTSMSPNQIEATVLLLLRDQIGAW